MNERQKKVVENILSNSASSLVAILLKNLEILEENKSLRHEFYRPIVRETVYNTFDYLKKIINSIEVELGGNNGSKSSKKS